MKNVSSRTPMVVLGLLCIEPMSGYDLKAMIEQSVGHFWHESYGQLYPALHELEERGCVVGQEASSGERRRKVYAITDAGRAALAEWLVQPPAWQPARNELLLKVFFGRMAQPEALRAHLEDLRSASERDAAQLAALTAQLEHEQANAPELRYWLLTIDFGHRFAQMRAEWARHALHVMAEGT
jgi:PadR family transcriptional regulator, regulatory protein AphA